MTVAALIAIWGGLVMVSHSIDQVAKAIREKK